MKKLQFHFCAILVTATAYKFQEKNYATDVEKKSLKFHSLRTFFFQISVERPEF